MAILDAIVVGAGAAGLVAAGELARAGLAVQVLEPRGRVGGRAWTERSTFGFPVDRGGAWLHSADRNPSTAYARQHGFTVTVARTIHEGRYTPEPALVGRGRVGPGRAGMARRSRPARSGRGEREPPIPRTGAGPR